MLDVGFANSHEDLVYDQNLTVGTQADHGTHVAGTIAATFDNGVGVDGVNPFADLVVNAPAFSGSGTAMNVRTSWGQQMSSGFFGLINARDDVLVVNASLGYNWGPAGINQNTSTAVHDLVEDQGSIFALAELIYVLLGKDLPAVRGGGRQRLQRHLRRRRRVRADGGALGQPLRLRRASSSTCPTSSWSSRSPTAPPAPGAPPARASRTWAATSRRLAAAC